jgi:hypothetical protein
MVDNIARVGLAGSRDENQMEKRLPSEQWKMKIPVFGKGKV